jgi:hypothetical protein
VREKNDQDGAIYIITQVRFGEEVIVSHTINYRPRTTVFYSIPTN